MSKELDALLDKANEAYRAYDEQKADRIIQEIAVSTTTAVPVMIDALRRPDKIRRQMAIRVLRAIGYPTNEPAIPALLYEIDPNLPGCIDAVDTLLDMGPDVVVPHIIQVFLGRRSQYWDIDVEIICCMLTRERTDLEYARQCCPAINYLLCQQDLPQDLDITFLFDVIEKAGPQVEYVIPTLIALENKNHENYVGEHARKLLPTFDKRVLNTYKLLSA